jgi:Reverse transcriptase (RNA-dependent DNA polymerase)
MDQHSGYWQVMVHRLSKEKTAFYVPGGKKHWNVLPMGILNAHSFFCAMVKRFETEWNLKAVALGIQSATSEIKEAAGDPNCETIVDDVILGADNPWDLILYFLCVLEVLEKYRVTVKLQKCQFMHQKVEFVGFGVLPEGNSPA